MESVVAAGRASREKAEADAVSITSGQVSTYRTRPSLVPTGTNEWR